MSLDQPVSLGQPMSLDQPVSLDQPMSLDQPVSLDQPMSLDQPTWVEPFCYVYGFKKAFIDISKLYSLTNHFIFELLIQYIPLGVRLLAWL